MKFIVFSDKEIKRLRKLKFRKKAKSQDLIPLPFLLSFPSLSNHILEPFVLLLSDEREERKLQDEAMK